MSRRRGGIVAIVLVAVLLPACSHGGSWQREACNPARPAARGRVTLSIPSGGTKRTALMYVPRSYDGTAEYPVVLDWHGYGSNAIAALDSSQMTDLADRKGFIIVAPQGEGMPTRFNLGTGITGPADDVRFASDLLDSLERTLCVDARRVYSVGVSNGGGMSALLACRLSHRFAAIGMVALLWAPPNCDGAAPSVLGIMGDSDIVVPFKGGVVSCCGGWLIPSAAHTMHSWSAQLQCTSSDDQKITKHVERRTWHGCSHDRQIVYYVVHGGGHTWPGPPGGDGLLGHTTNEISAGDVMWDFFAKHTTDR